MKTTLGGFTGCLRGLSVGGKLLDLTSKAADGIARGKWDKIVNGGILIKQKSCQNFKKNASKLINNPPAFALQYYRKSLIIKNGFQLVKLS